MYDVIVIGGGPAGVTAALRARELGASVVLVEAGRLGGTCTNDGCVPTRVLARAARLAREAQKFNQFGLHAESPTVDFQGLIRFANQVVDQIHEKKQIKSHLADAGVDVIDQARKSSFVDGHTIRLSDGKHLEGKKIIVCAGGHTRKVPFPGSEFALSIIDVWTLSKLPQSIAIVGGAATGCQVASILAAFGTKVHLLEVSPRILRLEDPLTSRIVKHGFMERGMNVITGIGGIEKIEPGDGTRTLHYKKDNIVHALQAEAVMMAIGWVGNLEGLNLESAGIETARGYITTNEYLQTSNPDVYAAGDINGQMMLVQSGSVEGRIAAENAILGPGVRVDHLIVPHGGFTDPEYASVGMTEDQARTSGLDYLTAVVPYADTDRAVIDREPEGFCKLIVNQEDHRVIGAHVVGEQAVEIVQLVAAGMETGMWVEQLAEMELAYPTYTAIIGLTARKIVKDLGVTPLSVEWRTLNKPLMAEWERSNPELSSEIYDSQSELENQFSSS